MWGPGIRVLSNQRNRSRLRRSRKSRFRNRRDRRYRLWDRRSRICRLLIQNRVEGPIHCLDPAGQAGPSSFSQNARENVRVFQVVDKLLNLGAAGFFIGRLVAPASLPGLWLSYADQAFVARKLDKISEKAENSLGEQKANMLIGFARSSISHGCLLPCCSPFKN